MANRGKRVYHGRRASPIVWLIALAVLIAAVVLVVAGVSKKDKPDPDPVTDVQTPDDGRTTEDPDGTDDPNTTGDPGDADDPDTTDDPNAGQTVSEPYIDASGLLQYPTAGHYVQADSYQGGGEAPWNLLLVNDWNPLPAGYDSDVTFSTVSGGKQVDSRIIDAVNRMLNDAAAYDLAVVSAYRPKEEQDVLYWRKVKQYTDKGYSDLEAQKVGGTIVKRPGLSVLSAAATDHYKLFGSEIAFSVGVNRGDTEIFLKRQSRRGNAFGKVNAEVTDVPRLIYISGYSLFPLRISYDEAEPCAVLGYPFGFLGVCKAVVHRVKVHCKSALMLGISRSRRIAVCRFFAVAGNIVVVKSLLSCV